MRLAPPAAPGGGSAPRTDCGGATPTRGGTKGAEEAAPAVGGGNCSVGGCEATVGFEMDPSLHRVVGSSGRSRRRSVHLGALAIAPFSTLGNKAVLCSARLLSLAAGVSIVHAPVAPRLDRPGVRLPRISIRGRLRCGRSNLRFQLHTLRRRRDQCCGRRCDTPLHLCEQRVDALGDLHCQLDQLVLLLVVTFRRARSQLDLVKVAAVEAPTRPRLALVGAAQVIGLDGDVAREGERGVLRLGEIAEDRAARRDRSPHVNVWVEVDALAL
eukprot:scaffold9409_cov116-Isochrysis_galbana.AAC.12